MAINTIKISEMPVSDDYEGVKAACIDSKNKNVKISLIEIISKLGIRISGTESGKPVTGEIEFQPGKGIRSTDSNSAIKFSSDGKQAQYKNSEIANKSDFTKHTENKKLHFVDLGELQHSNIRALLKINHLLFREIYCIFAYKNSDYVSIQI